MKKLCLVFSMFAIGLAMWLALDPSYLPDGGYIQHVSVVLLGFLSGALAMLSIGD